MAGEIRSSLTGDQFDLTNYTEVRTRDLIASAFSTPLDAPTQMVKFNFVVGGGKLVRAKYDEDLPKWMVTALRDIGFTEDRSAALDFTSQGTFKQQHDTGQNLKTIIVFPRVACAEAKRSEGGAADKPRQKNSPEYIITASELDTFKEIVAAKTPSWKQKKALQKVLQDGMERFQSLEAKLIRGELLTAEEQAAYDLNSGQDEQKLLWLQSEIKHHVDTGNITTKEKTEVLNNIDTNIASLSTEIEKATAEAKPKKVATLEEKRRALTERRRAVDAVNALPLHRLRHGDEIQKLRVKLLSFGPLEDKQRAQGLTLEELKRLEPKPDIEASVSGLEQASRGWFEDDDEFRRCCEFEEREARNKYAAKKKAATAKKTAGSSSSRGSSSSSGALTWNSVGAKSKPSSSSGGARAAPTARAGGSGFSAAFVGDSDSDSD